MTRLTGLALFSKLSPYTLRVELRCCALLKRKLKLLFPTCIFRAWMTILSFKNLKKC